jgi:hypothetical protein
VRGAGRRSGQPSNEGPLSAFVAVHSLIITLLNFLGVGTQTASRSGR